MLVGYEKGSIRLRMYSSPATTTISGRVVLKSALLRRVSGLKGSLTNWVGIIGLGMG